MVKSENSPPVTSYSTVLMEILNRENGFWFFSPPTAYSSTDHHILWNKSTLKLYTMNQKLNNTVVTSTLSPLVTTTVIHPHFSN